MNFESIFIWKAIYKDGSCLWKLSPDDKKGSYCDIDRSRLCAFRLYLRENLEQPVFFVSISDDETILWRERWFLSKGVLWSPFCILGVLNSADPLEGHFYKVTSSGKVVVVRESPKVSLYEVEIDFFKS